MPILTLVTPNPTPDFDMWIKKSYADIKITDRILLEADTAVQWHVDQVVPKQILDKIRQQFCIDIIQQTSQSNIRLFVADMDSTIVHGETLDDMADKIGIGQQISAITARAMRGDLDFEEALLARVALLENMDIQHVHDAVNDMQLNPGAQTLLSHLKSKNVYCVLISGGFTQFTSNIASRLRFDEHFGNDLIVQNNCLTGDVRRPILDKNFKWNQIKTFMQSMQIQPHQVMAVGDGANDLPMLEGAGLGVGYYPKPLLKKTLNNTIEYTDLSTLTYCI